MSAYWSTNTSDVTVLTNFAGYIYDQRGTKDNTLYGSYYLYQANDVKKQYKVVTYVNATSQDAGAAFPAFAYDSIIKRATGKSDVSLTFTTSPFTIPPRIK